MIKVICTTILFLGLSSIQYSQEFSIGIKDGITWSSNKGRYDYKNFENTQIEKMTGHNLGFTLSKDITNRL